MQLNVFTSIISFYSKLLIALLKLAIPIVIVVVIVNVYHNSKFYWEKERKRRWDELQPHLETIKEIYGFALGKGKIGWIDRNIKKTSEKKFNNSKQAYVGYIDFCKSKKLILPSNHQEIDEMLDTAEELFMSSEELLDKELKHSSNQYDEEYTLVCMAGDSLFNQRKEAVLVLENVEELINSIACSPKSFEKDIKEINVQKSRFKNTMEFGAEQNKAIETSAKSVLAGVATGVTVASMAPTAAMWVATTFGTASTGTAISALSGAAASNAALAWLGGGAIATGGGGIAAGHALLALAGPIGWGIAGTSLLVNVWLMIKKKLKIKEDKKEEIARLKNCVEALKEIKAKIDMLAIETENLSAGLRNSLSSCKKLKGRNYTKFTDKQKLALGVVVNNAKSMSALINKTVEE